MFRSMDSEEHFSKGTTPINRLDVSKESLASPWIGMLSALSRPLWSILHKYLPRWAHAVSAEDGKSIDLGLSLVPGFDSLMPAGQSSTRLRIGYVCCQHKDAMLISSCDTECLLMAQDSLNPNVDPITQMQAQVGTSYLRTVKQLLSQGFFNVASTQKEGKQPKVGDWSRDTATTSTGATHLHSFSQIRMSTDIKMKHHSHCDHGSVGAMHEWMFSECAGPLCFERSDDESLHTARLESFPRLSSAHEHNAAEFQAGTKTAATCSEVAVLTPDRDNGYSSLEDELSTMRQSNMNVCEQLIKNDSGASAPEAGCHGNGSNRDKPDERSRPEADENKEERPEQTGQSSAESASVHEASPVQSTYLCQNKAIAYILGGPCSDESDLEDSSDQDSDDDGFDSSDSSDLDDENDTDEDGDNSDSDSLDPESERLWNSLCQTTDPYNPRNFKASVSTTPSSKDTQPEASPSGSQMEPPTEPESFQASSLSSSSSPLGPQEIEEFSEDACSSTDEAESLRLWNSFSCSSDPYSPLNFQAPMRTCKTARVNSKKPASAGNLRYRKEEADERMDSGFSECYRVKKVTFVEEVEEFYASGDEERHGPWEEYARDRCRFRRRVKEVEESISYCLAPTFRLLTFQRLYPSS